METGTGNTVFPMARVFEIVQQKFKSDVWAELIQNPSMPLTLDSYWLTEDRIHNTLTGKESIKFWCWVLHDKDAYDERDTIPEGRAIGDVKPPHFHIYGKCKNAVRVDKLAKWFGVPVQCVKVRKGYGAFYDCIEYATHEALKQQEMGKHRYDDSEVHANFDWRKELDTYIARRDAFTGNKQQVFEQMRTAVYRDGLTIDALRRWADDNDTVRAIYTRNVPLFKKLRGEWLSKQEPPETLFNIYIEGKGGYGKGALSIMLARYWWQVLNPSVDASVVRDREKFFSVGDSRSGLQAYDGQQIVIWEDVRPGALMNLFGGRGATFAALDPHPKNLDFNIKYGTVKLINKVNIMNSVVPFREFAEAMTTPVDKLDSDEPEDLRQVTRRYCMWIVVREEDYEIMLNTGIYGLGTPKGFEDYKTVKRIDNNLIRLIQEADRNTQDRNMKEIVDALCDKKVDYSLESHVRAPKHMTSAEQVVDAWRKRHNVELSKEMVSFAVAHMSPLMGENLTIEAAVNKMDNEVAASTPFGDDMKRYLNMRGYRLQTKYCAM